MERRGFYCLVRNDLDICHRPRFLPRALVAPPRGFGTLLGISWVLEEVRFDLGTAHVSFSTPPLRCPQGLGLLSAASGCFIEPKTRYERIGKNMARRCYHT